jgi:hypothetical protein
MVEYSQLTDHNNRHADVDDKHCRETIIPLLERDGQINNPIMTIPKTTIAWYIVHGHNRSWSSNTFWPGKAIPNLVLDPVIYEITEDPSGAEISTPSAGPEESLSEYLSGVRCNPGYISKVYTIFCVVKHLRDGFVMDPSFHGRNPSKTFPNREGGVFDSIMDLLHPDQFLSKGTRTKIYNKWKQGAPGSATIAQTMGTRNDELAALKWDQGLIPGKNAQMSEKRRHIFKDWEWYDAKNNAYLGMTTSNGNKFREKILLACIEAHCEGRIFQTGKINLLYLIDKPSHVLANLQTQRDNQVADIKKVNGILKKLNIPLKINKARFVKQLNDSNDIGRTVQL